MKSLLTREGIIKAFKVKTRRTEKMIDDEWVALREKDKPKNSLQKKRPNKDEIRDGIRFISDGIFV